MDTYRGADFRELRRGSGIICGWVVHQTLLSWAGEVFKGLMADFMSPWSLELKWQLAGLQLLLLQFGSLCH